MKRKTLNRVLTASMAAAVAASMMGGALTVSAEDEEYVALTDENGIDPAADLEIDQSIDFGSTAAAFSGGLGEFTVEL